MDSGRSDSGRSDSGGTDSGSSDSGSSDSGSSDSGSGDSGSGDGGGTDAAADAAAPILQTRLTAYLPAPITLLAIDAAGNPVHLDGGAAFDHDTAGGETLWGTDGSMRRELTTFMSVIAW